MSLLSHPNILKAHCSFMVGQSLWVIMPFMSCGSLQSIIASNFPEGLEEPCIGIILREILGAVAYLHDQGHLHRDIKAGNILIDCNGDVKLADFGVSASIYESNLASKMLTDVAGTPYWMAPEVVHSHTGYSIKADIWSFGITALELAHGRPPLSDLPPSKSLFMKITKKFRFSDYEKSRNPNQKKFSKAFKDMVGLCLDQDPSKRPSAEKLLKHSFFRNSMKGSEFLVKNLLQNLPSVETRFGEMKLERVDSIKEEEIENVINKQRRVSGWNFNEDGFELDPILIGDTVKRSNFEGENSNFGGGFDREGFMGGLSFLMNSLNEQQEEVMNIYRLLSGEKESVEMKREEELMQVIEKQQMELDLEKKKNLGLELELEFLKLQLDGLSE